MAAAASLATVLGALLPMGILVAAGVTVGSVPEAVGAGFDSPPGRRLVLSVVAIAVISLAQQVVQQVRAVTVASLGRQVTAHLQATVMAATLAPTGIAHLEDPKVLDRIELAQGVGPGKGAGAGEVNPGSAVVGLADQLSQRLQGLAAMAIAARFRWWVGALLLASELTCLRLYMRAYFTYVRALSGKAGELRRAAYFRDLGLDPGAAREIRVFGLQGWVARRFELYWRLGMSDLWRRRRKEGLLSAIPIVTEPAAFVVALVALAAASVDGRVSLTGLVTYAQAILAAAVFAYVSPQDLQVAYGAGAVPQALQLQEDLAGAKAARLRGTRPADGLPEREIRFEGVRFAYPGADKEVFSSLDLVIPAGQSLAIVGENGAGKTTLVKLLARLYDPSAGRVSVDGVDLREIDPPAWQRRIAATFQDFTRYQLRVAENVGFGAVEHASDREALIAAAGRAGALDFIERLPEGWDTVLSRQYRGGCDLSGGQWQRLALARTLFAVGAGAGVLVLDEPTANLDVRAEAELYDQFLELTRGLTTVVISHRFSTVRRATCIAVLEHGRLVEQGSHDELVAAQGRYARMFELQSSRFAAAAHDPATGS